MTLGVGYVLREETRCSSRGLISAECRDLLRSDTRPAYSVAAGWLMRPSAGLLWGVTASAEYAGPDWLFAGLGLRVAAAIGGSVPPRPPKRKHRVTTTTTVTEPAPSEGWPSGPP